MKVDIEVETEVEERFGKAPLTMVKFLRLCQGKKSKRRATKTLFRKIWNIVEGGVRGCWSPPAVLWRSPPIAVLGIKVVGTTL